MSLVGLAEADDDKDLLDDYIEAQVHGPLLLAHDVEALVLDPCYIARFGSLADAFPPPNKPTPHPASDPSDESK